MRHGVLDHCTTSRDAARVACALVLALSIGCSGGDEAPEQDASLASTAASTGELAPSGPPSEPQNGRAPAAAAKPPERAFNVLLVTLDTTRADYLSCYDTERATTPNYDRVAREGVRFAMCISTAAITPVSHASILTGLNPYRHGLRVLHAAQGYRLPESVPTLASMLRDGGWKTGAFLSCFAVSEHFGLQQGFERFDSGLSQDGVESGLPGPGGSGVALAMNQRRSDLTSDRAAEWIRSTPQRFFAWIHYFDPHDGILLPPTELEKDFRESEIARRKRRPSLYETEIAFADQQFGRVLAALEETGRYDDTLIVLTADHGQGLGEHGWHAHRLLYQEQIHVPLILKLPGGSAGRVVEELVRTIDILPTVIEFLGGEVPPEVEGRSLLGLVRGEGEAPRIAYADQLNLWDAASEMNGTRLADELMHCIVEYPWKLIHRPLTPEKDELYDLAHDPDEARNLLASERAVAERLLAELVSRRAFVLEPFGAAPADSDAAAALKDLGYLGD